MTYKAIMSTYDHTKSPPVRNKRYPLTFKTEDELKQFMRDLGGMSWWHWRKFLWHLDKTGLYWHIDKRPFPAYSIVVKRKYD